MESLYLVEKEDYIALVERLIKDKMETELIEEREFSFFKVKSKQTNNYICACKFYNSGAAPEYYVFNLPEKDEWGPAKAKRRVELTEEESKLFWEELIKAKAASNTTT